MGVVRPRDADDVAAVLRYASENAIPITARGAGSGMPGHNVGTGLVLDFTKYMNCVVEVDPRRRRARVQPGVVLETLNRSLAAHGLHFAPDPGSGAYCTVGGMIANNAAGMRHLVRGATREHVRRLVAVLPSGRVLDTGEASRLARYAQRIGARHATALADERPHTAKNSSGYDLLGSLTRLFVGSEGTLGVIVEAEVDLVVRPSHRALALLGFDSLEAAGTFVVDVLALRPSAIEMMDRTLLDAYRAAKVKLPVKLPRSLEAVLLVEVEGRGSALVRDRIERVRSEAREAVVAHVGLDAEAQATLWQVRKAASPVLGQRTDGRRSLQFVEDGAVPIERLPEYVVRLRRIFEARRVPVAIFGHAGDAHLHVNPLLRPGAARFRRTIREIADDVNALLLEMHGTLTGEHGDGRSRAPYVERFFPRSMAAFREVKALFDPEGVLNPGVKIPLLGQRVAAHLRW
ncbi:MAG: FAD-binding protein [Planctomycetes bacterium]|nr:FAD-binding protein [Planctomycetota bacterium]